MKRDVIVYLGGRPPAGNAAAQRIRVNARLIQSLGYKVVWMGKLQPQNGNGNGNGHSASCRLADGIVCYDIQNPDNEGRYRSYIRTSDTVERVCQKLGVENIHAIIAYNYAPLGLRALMRWAPQHGIKLIADCTEWHGTEPWARVDSFIRFLLVEYKMRYLHKRVPNVICSNRYVANMYRRAHRVIVPTYVDLSEPKWHAPARATDAAVKRFIYAGAPGPRLEKEYVHWVVDAFVELKRRGHQFEFVVVGLTAAQYLSAVPRHEHALGELGDMIVFLGRLTHDETIAQIRQSDFFVFVRPNNRVSRVGFPTKLIEAVSCGVPPITNPTSDIPDYVADGYNGLLITRLTRGALVEVLDQAARMTRGELQAMKQRCDAHNPFRYELHTEEMRDFLAQAV
jgi:glycosyltransferase involved in cell wall biosynthesis